MVSHLTRIEYYCSIRLTITTVMVSHLTRIEYYCSIRLDHHYGYGQSLNTDRVLIDCVMVSHSRIESSVFYQTDHHYGYGQSLNTDRVLLFQSDWTITTVMVSHLTRIECLSVLSD